MSRIACIGECIIELREEADGRMPRSYGGDTLNTAVYLAHLGRALTMEPPSRTTLGAAR